VRPRLKKAINPEDIGSFRPISNLSFLPVVECNVQYMADRQLIKTELTSNTNHKTISIMNLQLGVVYS